MCFGCGGCLVVYLVGGGIGMIMCSFMMIVCFGQLGGWLLLLCGGCGGSCGVLLGGVGGVGWVGWVVMLFFWWVFVVWVWGGGIVCWC